MEKILKRLTIITMFVLTIFTYNIRNVEAATGTLSISASSSVTVGNNFTVTVKASGSKIFYWQLYVSYNASLLKLVSGSTTIQGEADDATYGTNQVSRTLTFKPLNTGSATISVAMGNASMNIDTNFNSISYATVKKTVNIVPTVPKSSNNKLASLSIDGATLSPDFNADTTSYTTEMAAGTTEINVNAAAADSKANVSGTGKINVIEGLNNINVVVTAEDGSTKTYAIAANVKEFSPIEVKIGNDKYSVIRKKGVYQAPKNFEETSIKIGEEDVLAYINKNIGCTIVGLKDADNNIGLYAYDAKTKSYSSYKEITVGALTLYIKALEDKNDLPVGYKSTTLKIGETSINAWNYNGNSKFYLLYGEDTTSGEESFYLYDKEKSTIQRFYNEQAEDLVKQLNQSNLAAIIAIGTAIVFLITSVLLLIKRPHKEKTKEVSGKAKTTIDELIEKEDIIEKEINENIKHKK